MIVGDRDVRERLGKTKVACEITQRHERTSTLLNAALATFAVVAIMERFVAAKPVADPPYSEHVTPLCFRISRALSVRLAINSSYCCCEAFRLSEPTRT